MILQLVVNTTYIIYCTIRLCVPWPSPQVWQLFQEGSLLQHLRHYLQLGDLHKAGCIWSRHSVSTQMYDYQLHIVVANVGELFRQELYIMHGVMC